MKSVLLHFREDAPRYDDCSNHSFIPHIYMLPLFSASQACIYYVTFQNSVTFCNKTCPFIKCPPLLKLLWDKSGSSFYGQEERTNIIINKLIKHSNQHHLHSSIVYCLFLGIYSLRLTQAEINNRLFVSKHGQL